MRAAVAVIACWEVPRKRTITLVPKYALLLLTAIMMGMAATTLCSS
jgi:hypothetical protein